MATFRASAAGGGSGGTGNRSATIVPAVNDLFVVFCNVSVNTNTAPTCSDNNGGTYTLVASGLYSASANAFSVFVRNQRVPNTTSTVVTVATGSNTSGSVVIVALSGMTRVGASAIRQSAKQENQAGSTTPAPAFPASALTANVTLGAVANLTNPATLTTPTSWTERQDVGQASPNEGLEVVSRDSGFTGTTITWGSTSASAFGSAIVEVDGSVQAMPSEEDEWQGGARLASVVTGFARAFAEQTVATSHLATRVTRQVDDEYPPPQVVPLAPDEDLDPRERTGPPRPLADTTYQSLPILPDPEELPAGSLTGQPDEDFDWRAQAGPPAPVVASIYQALPYLPDPEELPAGALTGQPDEDFPPAGSSPAPVAAAQYVQYPILPDPEEIPATTLAGQADEDFWQNHAAPVVAAVYVPLPILPDPEELPAGALLGQADEDFWRNWSAPTVATHYVALPIGDPEELPAGALSGQPDEDFWQNGVAPAIAVLYVPLPYLPDPEELVISAAPATLSADEDFWHNAVVPVQAVHFVRLPAIDPEELPAGSLSGQADEDFWINAVAPGVATHYVVLPILPDPEEIPASQLFGQPDEDFWRNHAAPVAGAHYVLLPLGDPEELPAGGLSGQPDEDFWQNWVAAVPAAHYVTLPYLPDPEEIAAATLAGQPDEDFWCNPTAPAVAVMYMILPLGDPEEIAAASLAGQPDEDLDWRSLTGAPQPVAASHFLLLPILPDPEELLTTAPSAPPDEDFWQNWTAPVPPSLYVRLPLGDPEELPAGNLANHIRFVLRDSNGALLVSTQVSFSIHTYASGNQANAGWMVREQKGTATTDADGVLDISYTGSMALGGLVYVAIFQPSAAPTQTVLWSATVE